MTVGDIKGRAVKAAAAAAVSEQDERENVYEGAKAEFAAGCKLQFGAHARHALCFEAWPAHVNIQIHRQHK
jgi:hypothetical protein